MSRFQSFQSKGFNAVTATDTPRVFYTSTPADARPTRVVRARPIRGIPRLPQELVELVLELLCDNKPALSRCSLVSRAWAKSTAPYFFGCIRWPRCHHWWSDDGLQYGLCQCGESDLQTLHDTLSSSSRMCEAVCELRVSFKRVSIEEESKNLAIMTFYVERLFLLLDALPNLRRLELCGFLDTHSTSRGGQLFQRSGRTLDALVLRRTVVDATCATHLITYFDAIAELTFIQPRCGGSIWKTRGADTTARPKTAVRELQVRHCLAPDTLTCLRTLYPIIPAAPLRALAVGQLASSNDTRVIEAFVRKAPRLEAFGFTVIFWLPSFREAFKDASTRERLLAGSESDWTSVVPLLDELGHTHTHLRAIRIDIKFNWNHVMSDEVARKLALKRLQNLDWSVVDDAVAALVHMERLELAFSFPIEIDGLQWRADVMAMLKGELQSRTRSFVDVTVTED